MPHAKGNAKKGEPLVVIKRNKSKPLVVVDAEYFIGIHNYVFPKFKGTALPNLEGKRSAKPRAGGPANFFFEKRPKEGTSPKRGRPGRRATRRSRLGIHSQCGAPCPTKVCAVLFAGQAPLRGYVTCYHWKLSHRSTYMYVPLDATVCSFAFFTTGARQIYISARHTARARRCWTRWARGPSTAPFSRRSRRG